MQRMTKLIASGALAVALIGAGTGIAVAGSNDESDDGGALSGSTRERAVAAALEATGSGRVSEAEHADDGGTYSVEVIIESGRHIEVKLDDKFHVIEQATDDDGSGNDGADPAGSPV